MCSVSTCGHDPIAPWTSNLPQEFNRDELELSWLTIGDRVKYTVLRFGQSHSKGFGHSVFILIKLKRCQKMVTLF